MADSHSRSWWLEQALAQEPPGPPPAVLEGEARADVAIVGGGFTGLWTALRLKELEPGLDVAVVEADVCGAGASGRNGGFVLSFWHHFLNLRAVCGTEEALRLGRASADVPAAIGGVCAEERIDAHHRRSGWLWTATSSPQLDAWRTTLDALEGAGETAVFEPLAPDAVAARAGSSSHLGGVFEATAATVQPALLARGLRRAALARGVHVYEGSPMVRLGRSRPLRVVTARGTVRAERVVLAMNAWSAQVRELRRSLLVVASDLVLTEPVPAELERIGWRDGPCISDSRLMVNYYRTTRDGRVAFGRGGGGLAFGSRVGSELQGCSPRTAWVAESLRRLYPALAGARIAAGWVGPIDRARDGLPFFGPLGRPDLLVGAGFSGNGVGPSYLGGRILASLALERDDEWSGCGLVREPPGGFPREPVRYLGGRVVRAAVARKEAAEDAGRPPRALDVRLAALAPAGLVPTD
jgi:putative aminophosphonate oxidoreductase